MARANIAHAHDAIGLEGSDGGADGPGSAAGNVDTVGTQLPGQFAIILDQDCGTGCLADLHQALAEGGITRLVHVATAHQKRSHFGTGQHTHEPTRKLLRVRIVRRNEIELLRHFVPEYRAVGP